MHKKLINTCIITIFLSITLNAQNNFKDFKVIEGLWKIENNSENSLEEWSCISDSLMIGKSYTINNKDTIINEFLKIKAIDYAFYYSAKVLNQNNAEEIFFKLIKSEYKTFTFENPNHDFPKRIIYNLSQKNRIVASIENDKKKFIILMKRINN